ncbi:restriction endonuclease subunit S [Psychrobacter sp.]|uniref:restriction endonuclease subunit S n=1 Tax=Psychrobacter sp. TaxID=56811 RepID=UPI0026491CE7|nr:restriction endonuclease subunit S [Psychrobacter sp.]MDN6308012.1 restriction endonuclease subunit S [Psychrobacter sp.]
MASDWEVSTLGELAEIVMGQSPKGADCNSDGHGTPLLNGPTEFGSNHPHPTQFTTDPKKFSKKDDLLFCVRGSTTGRMNWSDKEYAIGRGLAAFRHKKGKEFQSFLKGVIDIKLPELLASATGSTFPNVSKNQLNDLEVILPPLIEQKAIAHILGSLDDKIELNRQMNETLEAMAQALFKSWFVDFDPVIDNALAAGNAIPDELLERAEQRKTIEKKDKADIQKLFPDAFEFTEEMGWIPKGWAVEKLEQKIDVLNGFAFKSKDYVEKGLFVLRTKNFTSQGGVELLTDDVYLPNEFKDTFSKYLSEPFDYHLIMVGASVGNRGLIEPHQLPALRNQNMWCFRPKPNSEISKSYVKYMLDFITPLKLGLASGSAREFFRKGDFQTHQLCLPSNSVLNAFDQIAFSYLNKQAQNNSVNVSLSKLRDTLLPKLMSGELRIPDDIF